MKPVIREVIVVEGKCDTTAIHRACVAETIETGGSALHEGTLARIRFAQMRRGVIVCTDPDCAGERLRRKIDRAVPGCLHAFVQRKDAALDGTRIGIEYATPEAIVHALSRVYKAQNNEEQCGSDVTMETMWELGLMGTARAAHMREIVGIRLHIGQANAKTFLHRCQQFGIMAVDIKNALEYQMEERVHA
ncbi:MAG: ribonuclease M5 [Paenibacillaceae bacterium]|nr:ribonuclease M5 [Paenibacillaceae bacterium]